MALGEIPAALLLLVGISYLADTRFSLRHVWFAGLALGCAVMCKLIVIIVLPVLALGFLGFSLWERKAGMHWALVGCAAISGFMIAPLLASVWIWAVHAQVTPLTLWEYHWQYLDYHMGYAVNDGVFTTDGFRHVSGPNCWGRCWVSAFKVALSPNVWNSRYAAILLALGLFGSGLTVLFFKIVGTDSKGRFLILTALSVLPMAGWFFLYGPRFQGRYFLIGGFLAVIVLVLWLQLFIESMRNLRWRRWSSVFLLMVLVEPAWPLYRPAGMETTQRDIRSLAEWVNARSEIEELYWYGPLHIAMPYPTVYFERHRQWSYLVSWMVGQLDIDTKDYLRQHPGAALQGVPEIKAVLYDLWVNAPVDGKQRRLRYAWRQRTHESLYVFTEKPVFYTDFRPVQCAELLYENTLYALYRCQPDELIDFFQQITNSVWVSRQGKN